MTRLSLAVLCSLALAGCVVVPVAPSEEPPPPLPPRAPPRVVEVPPPPPRVIDVPPEPAPVVWYHGPHFVPEDEGGGWCYEEGAHTHPYFPDRPDVYVVDRGYYTYDGPTIFVYVGGHPLPGGGWCFLAGPHQHDYFPPVRAGFVWHRGHGYFYEGPYRANRPPPPAFWPRPVYWHRVPPPSRLPTVPAPVYRPPRNAPPTPPPRVLPAPPAERFDHDRGRFEDRDRRSDDRFDDRAGKPEHDRFEDRDRKDDRGRFEDRGPKDGRGRLDDRKGESTPAVTPQPKGGVVTTPGAKDRGDRALPGKQGNPVDGRKVLDKNPKDEVKPDKVDDAKQDAAGRPVRVRR